MTTETKVKTAAALHGLAERCEQAVGPDRELDMLIWAALNGYTDVQDTESGRVEATDDDGVAGRLMGWIDPGKHSRNFTPYGGDDAYPNVTASIDAAMGLVPEGAKVTTQNFGAPGPMALVSPNERFTSGATLSLALCAAALKARANSPDRIPKGGNP